MTSIRRRDQADLWAALGDLVRIARQGLGLSQAELAARAGLSKSTISRLENGAVAASVKALPTVKPETIRALYAAVDAGLDDGGREQYAAIIARLGITRDGVLRQIEAPPDDAWGSGVDASWQELFDQGAALGQQNAWEKAAWRLQAAQNVARNRGERAAALVAEAGARWHLASYSLGTRKCREALDELRLIWAPPDAGSVPAKLLIGATQRDLMIYGHIALRLAQIDIERPASKDMVNSARSLAVAARIGDIVDDEGLRYDAQHFRMRWQFDTATQPALHGLWRAVCDPIALRRALMCLQDSTGRCLRPPNDISAGHDHRWRGHILHLLGQSDQATQAWAKAEWHFANHPAICHILWDQGVIAMDTDPHLARRRFNRALDIAWNVQYAQLVSDSLQGLAYLEAATSRGASKALDCTVCALLAFPHYLHGLESRHALASCARLVDDLADMNGRRRFWQGYCDDVESTFIDAGKPPFNYLKGLHTNNARNRQLVLDAIEAHIHGLGHDP